MDLGKRPQQALDAISALTGGTAPVRLRGADPVFPTPFLVGAAGAGALGALGRAVARLWELRTGRSQEVSVDVRAAAASLRSATYLEINGARPQSLWDPWTGFYPVRDGRWVNIHCNFPRHREAMQRVLGGPADRKAAEAATRAWDGLALEEAIHAAGGCAGWARTEEEWAAHPHHAAVAREPLLAIERVGDAPPQPLPRADRPLGDVRVLDLTRVLAGPTCARSLAEHGADVLKISAAHLADSGPVEWDTGLGKRSAFLDLRSPDGVDTLRGLVREADVFSQSYRPGTLAARGFGPEEAARLRPGIVYATLDAWGSEGPWKDRRGFDSIVQTVSGMAYAQSGDSARPQLLPVSAIDYVSGYLMAAGVAAALARRATEGGSWCVRVSLAATGRWIAGLGRIAAFREVPAELRPEELQGLLEAHGPVRHLRPVAGLSETPPFWARPPAALGSHSPTW